MVSTSRINAFVMDISVDSRKQSLSPLIDLVRNGGFRRNTNYAFSAWTSFSSGCVNRTDRTHLEIHSIQLCVKSLQFATQLILGFIEILFSFQDRTRSSLTSSSHSTYRSMRRVRVIIGIKETTLESYIFFSTPGWKRELQSLIERFTLDRIRSGRCCN